MRRCPVILMMLFAILLTARANAQTTANQIVIDTFGTVKTPARTVDPQATPDAMVARMMSFDRNHDGLVSRDELPERMQPLLARIEVFTTGDGLDEKEIRRLAENPVARPETFVLQAGHYGFGEDSGFDTRLHIESAIEDLRLASATRDKALDIGHEFADRAKEQARAELLNALTPLLTDDQMAKVVAVLNLKARIGLPNDSDAARAATLMAMIARAERQLQQVQLAAAVASFRLEPEQDRQAKAAIETFTSHERLSDADRTALLGQMRDLLSDQERDDLRAALERRPIIKQGGTVLNTAPAQEVSFRTD